MNVRDDKSTRELIKLTVVLTYQLGQDLWYQINLSTKSIKLNFPYSTIINIIPVNNIQMCGTNEWLIHLSAIHSRRGRMIATLFVSRLLVGLLSVVKCWLLNHASFDYDSGTKAGTRPQDLAQGGRGERVYYTLALSTYFSLYLKCRSSIKINFDVV